MKNFKSIIKKCLPMMAAAALLCGATSCDDMLDTKPQGQFTDAQIGPDEAMDFMTAAYGSLLCHFFGNNESFAGPITNWVFDVRSDDALKGGDNVTMESYMHQLEVGNVQSDNDVINFKWRNNYYSINRCNVAIRAIRNAGDKFSDTERESLIAEMKTLRAYFWFDLYRIYKKFPYFDENVDLPETCSASEYTRDEIVEFIKKDLRDSYELLPATQPLPGRFNKYVAAALLARVDLFTSSWAEAEKYAGYVISSGQYQLYPNFLDMSKPEYNNMYESVLAIQFCATPNDSQYNFNNCLNCTYSEGLYGNGDDFYLASQDLVNAFRTDATGLPYLDGTSNSEDITSADYAGSIDPRLDFTLGRIGMPWRSHQYNENWCRNLELYGQYSGKKPYPAPEDPAVKTGIVPWGASTLNFILIRYADVLLMKAEALIEQGKDLEEARQLINQVRAKAARSVDPSYSPIDCNPMIANYHISEYPATGWNQEYARRAVRMERRLELAMEGLRWFDLVRWGNAVETVNKYYTFEERFQPYYQGANLTEDEIYFPIPLNQADNAGDLYK